MKKYFLLAIALAIGGMALASCTAEDDVGDENTLFGSWLLVHEEGWSSYDGDHRNWGGNPHDYGIEVTYTFREDYSGTETYKDAERDEAYRFVWNILEENGTLEVLYQTFYSESLEIKTLNDRKLVLQISENEFYNILTYERQ